MTHLHLHTRLAHAGCSPDPVTGALVASPVFSTTYERAADGSYPGGYVYSRSANPTRAELERVLTDLEGGAACATFASGMGAAHAVFAALPAGAHVVVADDVYYAVRHLLATVFEGVLTYTLADLSQPGALDAALRPETALVWAETPSNPLLRITDLAETAATCQRHGLQLAVDGTWATPLLQQPLALGADFVVHSLTKYLAGHSDVLGGAVIARADDERFARIRTVQTVGGGVLDPFSAWLTLRGLRSLHVRLAAQCTSTEALATFLAERTDVEAVYFPGLPTHPGHAVARQQMQRFGAMLSVVVVGGEPRARAVASGTRVFRQATSLGGTESLVEHRASVEGPGSRAPGGLLRLSIGLEHPQDLISDFVQALDAVPV